MARNMTDEDVAAIVTAVLASLKDQSIARDEFVAAIVAALPPPMIPTTSEIAAAVVAAIPPVVIPTDAIISGVVQAVAGKDEIVTAVADAVAVKLHTGAAFNANVVAMGGKALDPADPTTLPVTRFK
jgi:hypothetical protein